MKQLTVLILFLLSNTSAEAQEIIVTVAETKYIELEISNFSMTIGIKNTENGDENYRYNRSQNNMSAKSKEEVSEFLKANKIEYKSIDKITNIPVAFAITQTLNDYSFIELPSVNKSDLKTLESFAQNVYNLEFLNIFLLHKDITNEVKELHKEVLDAGRSKAELMANAMGRKIGELISVEVFNDPNSLTNSLLLSPPQKDKFPIQSIKLLTDKETYPRSMLISLKLIFDTVAL